MINDKEGRLCVTIVNDPDPEPIKIKEKLGDSWQLKDMDYFYTKGQKFYFVEVSEYRPTAYKYWIQDVEGELGEDKNKRGAIIKQYKSEQQQEMIKKFTDMILIAFSQQGKFKVMNNFVSESPKKVFFIFIYYIADGSSQKEHKDWRNMTDAVKIELGKYQTITGLPFTVHTFTQTQAEKELGIIISKKEESEKGP
ncbi:hypothetical protein P0082_05525 [Candidatus Haliotispira prima]|uniref:Uncharacterized protein n=1 Tax=Candidatus Haliotispira prima TaxID=3034016 RepID=A0ABY8MKB2_9SPIO|nr:hypothetical protein P0082_05525 [Candidatus Haliotispira prima]